MLYEDVCDFDGNDASCDGGGGDDDDDDDDDGGGQPPPPEFDAETVGTFKNTANWVLSHLNAAIMKLTTFNTKAGGPCAKDLTALGVNAQDVRTMAGQALTGSILIVNAATNLTALDAMESENADFGVYAGSSTIYYDTNYMWQSTMGLLMGTLIHEFSHVGTGAQNDAMDQSNLRITVGPVTANISKDIAKDCFGYKGPIE